MLSVTCGELPAETGNWKQRAELDGRRLPVYVCLDDAFGATWITEAPFSRKRPKRSYWVIDLTQED